jgi:site-specific DNA-methyltransferase (adenine-specific)
MRNNKIALDTINVGDAYSLLKDMPDEFIDLTITSPPYNKRKKNTGWLVNNEQYSDFDDHLPEDEYQAKQIQVLNELYRVTKHGGSVFYNHKLRWEEGKLIHPLFWLSQTPWTIKQEIVWDRGLAANMRGWRYWQVDERIYWLYKPINGYLIGEELESKHAKLSSIWRVRPVPRMNEHPAPFPIEIPARIIHSLIKEAKAIIFDPYCGTGTTLVAAKLLGHHFYGLDISESYASFALNRLERSKVEEARVMEECSKHVIIDTFISRKKKGIEKWPFGPRKNKKEDSL